MILVNVVLEKFKFSKNVNNKNYAPKLIFFNEKKNRKTGVLYQNFDFSHENNDDHER